MIRPGIEPAPTFLVADANLHTMVQKHKQMLLTKKPTSEGILAVAFKFFKLLGFVWCALIICRQLLNTLLSKLEVELRFMMKFIFLFVMEW